MPPSTISSTGLRPYRSSQGPSLSQRGPEPPASYEAAGNKQSLYWLMGAFLVLAPASMAPDAGLNLTAVKLIRIGVLGLVFLVSFPWFRRPQYGTAPDRFLVLAFVFTLAAFWSSNIMLAFTYKGLFLASCITGIALGNAISSRQDMLQFLKVLLFFCALDLAIIVHAYATGGAFMYKGRLIVYGLNANLTGQTMSLMASMSLLLAVQGRGSVRGLACICGVGALVVVVLTGSRGALAVVLSVGVGTYLFLLIRKSPQLVKLTIIVTVLGVVMFYIGAMRADNGLSRSSQYLIERESVSEITASESELRLFSELTKNTRKGIWRSAIRKFRERPLVGNGWMVSSKSGGWSTFQSAYLQILVEVGLIGCIFLLLFLVAATSLITGVVCLSPRLERREGTLALLFAAVAGGGILHGAFESALIVGTGPNAVVLAFALTRLEAIRQLSIRP